MNTPAVLSLEDALQKRPGAPPFTFAMADARGRILRLHCAEVIQAHGKRSVLRVFWRGREAAAKIYSGPRGPRKSRRETRAYALLHEAGLPTPELLHAAEGADRRSALLLFAWLPDATTARDALKDAKNPTERMRVVEKMLDLTATMHHHGLLQGDCQPKNFLFCGERSYAVDLENVGPVRNRWTSISNLIQTINLQPASMRPALLQFLEKKHRIRLHPRQLEKQRRLNLRGIRLIMREDHGKCGGLTAYCRLEPHIEARRETLQKITRDPGAVAACGEILQQTEGRRTVRTAEEYGGLILQCYDPPQGLRTLRPSRAWRCRLNWLALRDLARGDIRLPRALACIEERRGPFRGRSWLALDPIQGESLAAVTRTNPPHDSVDKSLRRTFVAFYALRALPQDLRADGFIVAPRGGRRVFFTALEDVRYFHSRSACARAWPAMQRAFLANWPASHPCHARYRKMLEAIPRESPF